MPSFASQSTDERINQGRVKARPGSLQQLSDSLDSETEVVARFEMRREMAIGASLADPVPGAWSPDVLANRIA